MTSPPPPTTMPAVPTYMLFGEVGPWPIPEMVHCESIAARSELHNWQITPHRHHGLFQVLHLQRGSAEVHIDGITSHLQGGQLLLVPQMCVHGFRFKKNAQGHVVTLAYPLIHKLAAQAGDGLLAMTTPIKCPLDQSDERTYLQAAFQALEAEYRARAPFRPLRLEAILASILVTIGSRLAAPSTEPETLRRGAHYVPSFCELIETHYAEHKPVSFYAKRLGITAAHLNALCRQALGRSALELVHERVLLEAKRNLIYTSMTVSVVSYTAGFSDPAYFTRFFKRAVGVSPREFRLQVGTLGA